ncbi:hypothetical protein ACIQYS_09705 [Psychrobacillus sp. NPDC096426]|uniref:Acb2/Tad1 domain-containing protein n=1 Tax=Psychrobacillus sp. NPDC096426 TaxID=3364491 RepID=UPI0038007BE5
MPNKCFNFPKCKNESVTEFCPDCLDNGGIYNPIHDSFTYHAPKKDQVERYETIRNKAKELALLIDRSCPRSREKSLAQTNLEQAVMWANKSIACNE